MTKLYYWRRGRINPTHLFVIFANQENSNGISAYVKPVPNDGWHYHITKPFRTIDGNEATQALAQSKVEESIDYEFRPEYIPYFG
jgi:hypothetical protein